MRIQDLSKEQVEKAKKFQSKEEWKSFLNENSIELEDDMLDAVSGGSAEEDALYDRFIALFWSIFE
jgi:hypothetical protein